MQQPRYKKRVPKLFTRLTDEHKKEIAASTETVKYLAYKYGCGETTIYKIRNNK